MPKKTRRMKERAAMRRTVIAEEARAAEGSEARPTLSPSSRATYSAPIFDYSHIYNDLRRIAFFAVLFFGVLIALSFVIK